MSGVASAVIVAGGVGRRFGNPAGKLMVDLAGRPLVSWTVEAFDRARSVGEIVIVCRPEVRDEMRSRALTPFGFATPVVFADAGAERQDSTAAGVAAASGGSAVIAVHDAARPLISPETIDAAVEALLAEPDLDGVVCGQPAIDTLKVVEEGPLGPRFIETPPRARYWTVQTPQVFRADALRRAIARACEDGFTGTDDASLVEHAGGAVVGFAAPRDNLKVTVPEDLRLAELLLARRGMSKTGE